MPRNIFLVFIILLLVSCGGDVPQKRTTSVYKEGEIIVKFKSGIHETQKHNAHNVRGAKLIKKIGFEGLERIKLPNNISVQEAIQSYKTNPDVEYAEPNYIVKAAVIIPNDTRFGEQWGLHNTGQAVNDTTGTPGADIHAPEAWDITQSSNSIIVAVIDSGIDYNHPDLIGNIWHNSGETNCSDGIDNDGNGYVDDCIGWDFVGFDSDAPLADNDPMDEDGHGTHVAGIIGAVGDNSAGISGVSWSAKIMPLKVLDHNGYGNIADIVDAIAYASLNNARIINMSFSDINFSQALHDSIASHPEILFVAAAGNSGSPVPEYPAGFDLPNIISVAATDQNDNLASFSNYGQTVNVAAPGTNILSTMPSFITGVTYNGTYRVVYLSFGIESINDASSRDTIMKRVLDFHGITKSNKILLVDDDGVDSFENYYKESLQDYTFDVYTVPLNSDGPSFSKLNQYKLVIWFTGCQYNNSQSPVTLTPNDQANLQSYFDNGGRLFLTGQDIGYEIGSTNFYQNYLKAFYITDDALGTFYTGVNDFNGLPVELQPICTDISNNLYASVDAVKPLGSVLAFYIHYNDAYQFLDGTSMATSMVSGIAALIASLYSNFSADQIKGTILNSVDVKPSLQGKILTGGRVNAYKVLTSLVPPSGLNAVVQSETQVLLTWTYNSSDENGFSIERKESRGQFTEIALVLPAERTYTDSTVIGGEKYTYRVRAFNSVTNSAYSNEASVTIPGGNNGGGGGGGGCSIGTVHNVQTALADTVVLLMPLVVVWVIKRFRKH